MGEVCAFLASQKLKFHSKQNRNIPHTSLLSLSEVVVWFPRLPV